MRRLLLFFIICFSCASCTGLFLKVMGMKKLRPINDEQILKYGKKYSIEGDLAYKLDTAKYMTFLRSIDTTKFALEMKNHAQPLQALYFDRSGQLISWQINCYAGGFPNLAWERDSIFATFPPKQQAPIDTFLNLEKLYRCVIPIDDITKSDLYYTDYTIVVFWSRWMGRQSERLIALVEDSINISPEESVRLIYVNNDNLFAGMEMK